MLLAIDIGNTNTTCGVFDNKELAAVWRLETVRRRTSDETGVLLRQFFSTASIDHRKLSGIIISSVVSEVDAAFSAMSENYFGMSARFVDETCDFGLKISYRPPSGVGADRLVDAFAAVEKYGAPCIVCDFGTATTIDAVNSEREYLGGIIAPGIRTLADSLFEKTSKLPNIQVIKPETVIGGSTVGSIQSGVYFGYIGLVDGIIRRMIAELNETPQIISTGGWAEFIAEGSELVKIVENHLMLDGLRLIFERPAKQL